MVQTRTLQGSGPAGMLRCLRSLACGVLGERRVWKFGKWWNEVNTNTHATGQWASWYVMLPPQSCLWYYSRREGVEV